MILNRYSLWRYILVTAVVAVACLYAAPNLYGEDPAVQITGRTFQASESELERVKSTLEQESLAFKSAQLHDDRILVRFEDGETQLQAVERLKEVLGNGYSIALNLAPATPEWLRNLNALPMYLGLDLRGGVHFLMQVDMEAAVKQSLESYSESIRLFLRDNDLRYRTASTLGDSIFVRFKETDIRDQALSKLQDEYAELSFVAEERESEVVIIAKMRPQALEQERKAAISQNITTLRNRVNELGVSEPVIQQQGQDRIVVQLPGVQDTAQAKRIIGATATLEYRLVHGTSSDWASAAQTGRAPVNTRLYKQRSGEPVLLKRSVIVTGESVTNATAGFDSTTNLPAVIVTLDGKGADRMSKISGENIGNLMAVVFIENKVDTKTIEGKSTTTTQKIEEVISVATIRDQLGRRFQTTGLTQNEAKDLALLLRAGALKAPMQIIEERTVGPSLGKDNIRQGFNSVVVGLALVLVFMVFYYRVFGLIANVALVANIVLMIAVLSILQATLTMPGIAGIVLTVGMAVDANVLVFERIREELRNGNSVQASIHAGYEKAFATIADANITTLIAAIILFGFGTGPIKGFAVTLSIGILTSMFTAIMLTRAIVNFLYGARNVKKLAI